MLGNDTAERRRRSGSQLTLAVAVAGIAVVLAAAAAGQAGAVTATTAPTGHLNQTFESVDAQTSAQSNETDGVANASVDVSHVTLVTGDTVAVVERGSETTYRVLGNASATVQETESGTYVVPNGVNLTRFDRALFNVDLLLRDGLSDAEADSIPVIVEWANDPLAGERSMAGDADERRSHRTLELIGGTAMNVSKANASETYRRLATNPQIQSVHYDAVVRGTAAPNRTEIDAVSARERYGVSGDGVTVAVLDSGVNESHPDVDDAEVGERDFTRTGTTEDRAGHGTAAAGLIAGDGTASNGTYVGVAPDADVLDVKVLRQGYPVPTGRTSNVIDGIQYAIEHDAGVISMSFGFNAAGTPRGDDPLAEAVDKADDENVTLVTAAGNYGEYRTVTSPGTLREPITVGASDDGRVASFSSRGPTPAGRYLKPDVVASGTELVTTGIDDAYTTETGTSFATPLTSGTVALVREAHPNWSDERIKNALTGTADPLDGPNVYEQGAGRINASAALGTDVVVDPATTDFGTVTVGTSETETATVRNLGSDTAVVNLSASARSIETGTSGNVTLNRSQVRLEPGETATVALTVAPDDGVFDPRSGRVRIGNQTAVFGYVPTRTVTVDKRSLGSADGDRVTLVGTETDSTFGPRAFDNGSVTFEVSEPGRYVAVSAGTHDSQPVITANGTSVEGSDTIVLDEKRTVVRTVDAESLPHSEERLHTRAVVVNATLDTGPIDERIVATEPGSSAVRVSPTSEMTYAVRRVLTVSPGDDTYDAPAIYHLEHVATDAESDRAVEVDVDELNEQRIRYYRGERNESYSATVAADNFDDVPLTRSYVTGGIGDRFEQTIYVSPTIAQYHDAFAIGDDGFVAWTGTDQQYVRQFENESAVTTAVRKHPFRSKVTGWTLTERRFAATVFPTLGQGPRGYVISDLEPEQYDLWVDGERVRSFVRNRAEQRVAYPGDGIGSVRLRVDDRHGLSHLSNDTVTTFGAATDGDDDRPPSVPNVEFESQSPTNVVPNGTLNVTVATSDAGSDVESVDLYVAERDAAGSPETTPFNDTTGWRSVNLTRVDDGTYEAALDLGEYRGALSVAVRAEDGAGNYVETTATDAVVVGDRRPVAAGSANAALSQVGDAVRLDASASYDDRGIEGYRWDVDGDGSVDAETDEPTIEHEYDEPGQYEPRVTAVDVDGYAHEAAIDTVTVAPDVETAEALDPRTRFVLAAAFERGRVTVGNVTIASEERPIGETFDDRTLADAVRAAERSQVATADGSNGRPDVQPGSLLFARGDLNGRLSAGENSTVVLVEADSNGRIDGHNLVAADARFDGRVTADGTVTVVSEKETTVRGGLEAAEAVRVTAGSALEVSGPVTADRLVVGENATLTVSEDVHADQITLRDGATVTADGRVDCQSLDESDAAAGSVDAEVNCG